MKTQKQLQMFFILDNIVENLYITDISINLVVCKFCKILLKENKQITLQLTTRVNTKK